MNRAYFIRANCIDQQPLCDSANEFYRRFLGQSISKFSASALPYCCIEIASLTGAQFVEYAHDFFIGCSATTAREYDRTFDLACKVLAVKPAISISMLCSQHSLTEQQREAVQYAHREIGILGDPCFDSALFISCCERCQVPVSISEIARRAFCTVRQLRDRLERDVLLKYASVVHDAFTDKTTDKTQPEAERALQEPRFYSMRWSFVAHV